MKKRISVQILTLATALGWLSCPGNAVGSEMDKVDKLLKLLEDKKIVSAADAAALRQEMAATPNAPTPVSTPVAPDKAALKQEIKADLKNEGLLSKVDIHGFVSQGALLSEHNNYLTMKSTGGSLQFSEVAVNFSTEISDKLRAGIQIMAKEFGQTGTYKPKIDWAFADYSWRDWLGVRVGKMKAPYGLYGAYRDLDMTRPWIIQPHIYNELQSETYNHTWGLGAYGNVPLHTAGSFDYQFQYGTVEVDPIDGGSNRLMSSTLNNFGAPTFTNDDVRYKGSANLEWNTPLDGLKLGYNFTTTNFAMGGNTAMLFGPFPANTAINVNFGPTDQNIYSVEYLWHNLTLAAEYNNARAATELALGPLLQKQQLDVERWYASAAYRFCDRFEGGVYYSEIAADAGDRDGSEWAAANHSDKPWLQYQHDFTIATRFDITKNWLFKLEYHLIDGVYSLLATDNPSGFSKNWSMVAAKTTFTF